MLLDKMSMFPNSWSEMLPLSECDVCGPPLDIGPPPPLPANFQERADLSGGCNICHLLSDVEMRPTQLSDASPFPIIVTLVVGMMLITVTLVVLLVKIKKCRAFIPHVFCWIFPRNLLPHTELAPSSLPSPSPSTEKLKGGKHLWHGSSRSLQSENIYEVCSPPSQDSLYEEVGPPGKNGPECSPYGVVLVEKSPALGFNTAAPSSDGFMPRSWLIPGPGYGSSVLQQPKPSFVGGTPHFSTFGGSGRGFFNPALRDAVGTGSSVPVRSSQTLGLCHTSKGVPNARSVAADNTLQKRQLPPVPLDAVNFSL